MHARGAVKTRMVWLPDCEDVLKICLFISTECADGQTDKICKASRGENTESGNDFVIVSSAMLRLQRHPVWYYDQQRFDKYK